MLIGWQGISARVPADWTLAGVGGDRRQGYLRVDREVGGFGVPALQVKWASRHIDLEKKRAEYVRRLEGKGSSRVGRRRITPGLEVTTDLHAISKRGKPKKQVLAYGWRGEGRTGLSPSATLLGPNGTKKGLSVPSVGIGVLWNCEICGRAVIAQVGWPIEEEGREAAQEVLESLDDHGTAGWDAWGVDGLVFLAPTEYELEGWKRMTRYLELRLVSGQEKLKVARWGMVPLVLKDRTVREWYDETNRSRRDVSWASEEAQIKDHEGVVAWGERRMWGAKRAALRARRRVSALAPRLPFLHPHAATEFGGCAWHCPESNRLWSVEALYNGEGEALQGVVASVICHEGL